MLSDIDLSKCVVGNPIMVIPERYLPYRNGLLAHQRYYDILKEYPNSFGHIVGFSIDTINSVDVLALKIKTADCIEHTISDKDKIIFLRN